MGGAADAGTDDNGIGGAGMDWIGWALAAYFLIGAIFIDFHSMEWNWFERTLFIIFWLPAAVFVLTVVYFAGR